MNADKRLQRHVMKELGRHPELDAAQIGVSAKGGVVALSGHVATRAHRCIAEEVAKHVPDVRAVANDLEVMRGGHQRDDTDVAAAVVHALQWDDLVPDDQITAAVRHGVVALEGAVRWQFQKDAAERAVQNLAGVTTVVNAIAVAPRPAAVEPVNP